MDKEKLLKEKLLIKIDPVGCSLIVIPKILEAITKVYPNAKVRQENGLWIIFEETKSCMSEYKDLGYFVNTEF